MAGYDYIVIGAGSAGAVAAARLSEDPAAKVLLLEAGGTNKSLLVTMPLGIAFITATRNAQNWGFMSEPEPHLNNRRMFTPRGKGLGGSSAINGMVYIRGNAKDYDQWAQMGLQGWSYDDVLPYFRKSEDHEDGADEFHGAGGPLHIINANTSNPLNRAVIEAAQQAGYPFTPDFNGPNQEGIGWYDFNVKGGRRASSAEAFLTPAAGRPNLTVKVNARTTRILLANGRAVGVEYVEGKGGEAKVAHVDGEVVVSAGAFQSPHILQLSGIGDPERLARAGIETKHALRGVGANLHDHLDLSIGNVCTKPWSMVSRMKGGRAIGEALNYLLFKKGFAAEPFFGVGGFFKSRPELDRPDRQLVFVSSVVVNRVPQKTDGYTFHMCILDPESRGFVDARSADPFEDPKILFNHMATENDKRGARHCIQLSREIIAQPALQAISGRELLPGEDVRTEAEIDAWIRENAETPYHPGGSCRMGVAGDPDAVVDNQLRVFGLEGLRVADASVMPKVVGGNTNAPSMMIGEKVADMIRTGRATAA